jgi:uncharacterized membrane protein
MTNVPRQVQSFPESLYRKRDGWVVIILWLVIIVSLASAIYIPLRRLWQPRPSTAQTEYMP